MDESPASQPYQEDKGLLAEFALSCRQWHLHGRQTHNYPGRQQFYKAMFGKHGGDAVLSWVEQIKGDLDHIEASATMGVPGTSDYLVEHLPNASFVETVAHYLPLLFEAAREVKAEAYMLFPGRSGQTCAVTLYKATGKDTLATAAAFLRYAPEPHWEVTCWHEYQGAGPIPSFAATIGDQSLAVEILTIGRDGP